MVSNIVILGVNRSHSRQVAEMLSERLQMYFVDTIDLFEFDNIPRSFSIILKEQGERYFREKEKSLNKYVSGFENTVIHAESGSVLKSKNIQAFKKKCLVIYLHSPLMVVKKGLEKKAYESTELKRFFNISQSRLKRRIELLKKAADIVVPSAGKSPLRVTSEVLRAIDKYYLN